MKKTVFLLSALILLAIAGCGGAKGTGTLTGKVNIGPISPVATANATETVPCSAYAARSIVIFSADGKKEIASASIDCDGRYGVQLAAGTYTVDINHAGIDRADGLPTQVTISANLTTRLDVSIDTGIR